MKIFKQQTDQHDESNFSKEEKKSLAEILDEPWDGKRHYLMQQPKFDQELRRSLRKVTNDRRKVKEEDQNLDQLLEL